MSLAKFIDLVSSKTMYFPQARQFEDPYEGHLPDSAFREVKSSVENSQNNETDKNYIIASLRNLSHIQLVSCWHASDHESEAMWKLYSQEKQCIAIKTTTHKLIESIHHLPEHTRAGLVQYIDFNNPPEPLRLDPIFFKRLSYSHEREFRISFTQQSLFPKDHGDSYPCDTETLIQEIYISPWSDRVFKNAATAIAKTFTPDLQVKSSELLRSPYESK